MTLYNIVLHPFYRKFAIFTDVDKKSNFFPKKPSFRKKTQIAYVFEKSYNCIRILRQICYNLVTKNFHNQNRALFIFCRNRAILIGK